MKSLFVLLLVGVTLGTALSVEPQQTVEVSLQVVECVDGSRWRVGCNWCTCSGGRSRCTRDDCVGWDESKAQKDGVVECHGTSEWKKDCNWCNCVNGRGLCTAKACIPAERDPFHNLPESAICVPGSRWKIECNWCSCTDNGGAACTLIGCLPGFREEGPTCEEGSVWKSDSCNHCRCVNGVSACTKRLCRERTEPQLPEQPQEKHCEGDPTKDRWREDCNWCRCTNGIGVCTRRLCPEGFKDTGPACEGRPRWKSDCNTCNCVNGTAVCTSKFCGPLQVRPITVTIKRPRLHLATQEKQCEGDPTKDRWREDCNWCRCVRGVGVCTRRLCAEGRKDSAPPCEGEPKWKKGCNSCVCVNGTAVCTSKFCGPLPPRPDVQEGHVQVQEPRCTGEAETDQWTDGCNWCHCSGGAPSCTEKACLEDIQQPQCKGNPTWKEDCNNCRCSNGIPICTSKFCGPLPPRAGTPRGTPELPTPASPQRPQCEGNPETDRWRQQCNWCRCVNGIGLCTKRLCREDDDDDNDSVCEGSPSWMSDCNRCYCVNGQAICTSKFCGPLPPRPEVQEVHVQVQEPRCTGDAETGQWTVGCNWCRCSNGVPVCTKKACPEGVQIQSQCKGNATWKDDCNNCRCSNGIPICTSKFCGGPISLRKSLLGVSSVKGKKQECVDGARWRIDCNWCTCEGGKAICTEKHCLNNSSSSEPECEGDSTFKRDCNWCSCSADGFSTCTRMACLKESEQLCTEGASWREDCNICRCSQGFTLCTKKACITPGKQLECQGDSCTAPQLPDLCHLPPVTGNKRCFGFMRKWSFYADDGQCKQIVYGGCGGTENLFSSKGECEEACPTMATTLQTQRTLVVSRSSTSSGGDDRCTLPKVEGPCFASLPRYAYNAETRTCEEFIFGGCAGNANNFMTKEECLSVCQVAECDKRQCAWNLWQHYLVKGCVPQYASDACCPTSFQCPSASESQKEPSMCHYKGVAYNVSDYIPVEDPCSASCLCSTFRPDSPPEIQCANVECPELFNPPTPGCRGLYRNNECCAYDYDCVDPSSPPLEPRGVTCQWGNMTYEVGSKMYFDDHPCRVCICGPGFTDPYGPGCSKINCGLEFRYTSQLDKGCTPIQFGQDRCCPIDWMCPDDSRIDVKQQQQQSEITDESAVCHLGGRKLVVGETLALNDCKIECRCVTPPELTCIQYSTCEAAREAAAQRVCPTLACGPGCQPVLSAPDECPTCSCPSSNTFSCPAEMCPNNCRTELDLDTGCPSCKCQCPENILCPTDCPVHTLLDEETGCPYCECQPGSPLAHRSNTCPEYPGGEIPCPMDCGIIKKVNEFGCEVCECDPNDTENPFLPNHPLIPPFCPEENEAPCPMDCAVIRTTDENGCEVCRCDPNNPISPFGPPLPSHPRNSQCVTMPDGRAPCPMDCAVIRSIDENGCEVCRCDPNNPISPFGPPPPPHPRNSQCVTMPDGRAPCPMDCAIIRSIDENGCEVCRCDPNNPISPFGP